MAKPNYQFAKRQRDLAKKQKKEERRRRKSQTNTSSPGESPQQLPADDTINTLNVPGDCRGTVDNNEEQSREQRDGQEEGKQEETCEDGSGKEGCEQG